MKINPGQTRGLDRILDRQLGTGTSILSEGASVILTPGAKDQIQLSQLGNRLQILVNGSEKFLLTERESQNFDIRGDQKNITIDPSVSLFPNQQNVTSTDAPVASPEVPLERGEQLGHARRMEGAFETAVTRKAITDELKEDVFINHIGKQMQRFLGELGITMPPQTAFRTEKDLLPFMTQLENITGKGGGSIPFPREFMQDLNGTVRNLQQQVKNGEPLELELLGSQLTRGLKQIIDSKTGPTSEIQLGKIPFEAHEIPVGMNQRDAFQKWGLINEAIVKNDIGMIREFANDPEFLKLARPEEKAAFVATLSDQTLTPGTEHAEKMLNLNGMVQFLQSAQNSLEFKSILNMAGIEKVHLAMEEAAADFNITAHVFQAGKFALDPNQPLFITNPLLQGFTPQQILAARQEMALSRQAGPLQTLPWSSEDAARFSENPLSMLVSTPHEKALMIRGLQTGYVSVQDERSIVNILQSAMDKTEFDQILESAGGKAIGLSLQDPAAIVKWNRLAGAYDRMDLTTDFVEGVKNSGALLEPFPFGVKEQGVLQPLQPPWILRDQRLQDVVAAIDTFIKDAGTWIGKQVGFLDRRAYVEAGLENLNRTMEGLPVLNIPAMRDQLHAILQSPTLQPQQILNHLQSLASATGLGGYELRNLVSQPLAFIHQTAAGEAAPFAKNVMSFFQENLLQSVFNYGPRSPQARFLQAQMERVQTVLLPFLEHLKTISTVLSEAFPPPTDFIVSLSQFASVFKNKFAPILLDVVSNFPALVDQSFANTPSIQAAIKGERNVGPSTAPITQKSSTISQLVSQLTTLVQGSELIRNGDLARQFSETNQQLLRMPGVPPDLTKLTKQAISFLSSIQDGSFAKALKEVAAHLKKYEDPIGELAKTTAEEGAAFLSQLQNGTLTKIQREFVTELDKFQNDPAFATLKKNFGQIASLTEGILGGTSSPKITDEAGAFISEIAGKEFRSALTNIGQAAARFRESPAFRNLIDSTEKGGRFLTALRSGNFAQTMELMHSRFGYTPAVVQVIERGLHLSTTGSYIVKALVGRDFERPIAQITRKAQAKTEAAKEVAEAQTLFTSASTFFYALTDVENMNLLWRYHRQLDLLKDEALIDSTIRQFEKQAQILAAEPDLKKSLLNQFAAFQHDRARNSKN